MLNSGLKYNVWIRSITGKDWRQTMEVHCCTNSVDWKWSLTVANGLGD